MATVASDRKLKSLIKESVKEVLEAELMKLRAFLLPEVSHEEQKDIEELADEPATVLCGFIHKFRGANMPRSE